MNNWLNGGHGGREGEILAYIRDHYKKHGYVPSYRAIGAALGISSTSNVHYYVHRLIDAGHLKQPTPTIIIPAEVTR